MKFETIIIGGGLAGLTTAVRLAEKGQDVALVSAGSSALHLNSGSLSLLGFDGNHNPVSSPLEEYALLPATHPYKKIDKTTFSSLAEEAKNLLSRAGIETDGNAQANHTRLSPLGILRPAWLTVDGLLTVDKLQSLRNKNIAIAGIAGFLDFYPRFIASALKKEGFSCELLTVDNDDLRNLRKSGSEMRAPNIARLLRGEALTRFGVSVSIELKKTNAATVILPAVFDLSRGDALRNFENILGCKVFFAPTMGVSVPGMAIHNGLVNKLRSLGGTIFNGHRVVRADFQDGRLLSVFTDKLDNDSLRADNFVFAGGSFFSRGLVATPDEVIEPALGLDTVAPADRSKWFDADLLGKQPVMDSGVNVDSLFRGMLGGKPLSNLYAVGSALAGANSMQNDSGAGVAMLTALATADLIINSK